MKKVIMSLALAGFLSAGIVNGTTTVDNPKCCKKTSKNSRVNNPDDKEADRNRVTHNKVTKSKPAQKVGDAASYGQEKVVDNKVTNKVRNMD
ncbi:MAG TPA: hypothetical protein VF691_20100 [Cytophagaceae bacterium]